MKLTRTQFLNLASAGAAVFALPNISESAPPSDGVLSTLRPGHPRLIITDERLSEVKKLIERDPVARGYRDTLRAAGEKMLTQPPVEYVLIGPRLLDKSRTCVSRIYTLATLYRLDGDVRWRDRAVKELLAVSAFADWHTPHFLDTAEMTHAVAIGYDWLYPALTPEERATIRRALVDKGLRAGQVAYAGKSPTSWWTRVNHNWNLVCNGGLTLGALAVADEEPEIAGSILNSARKSAPLAFASYGPDGGWIEGPGYWGYATQYAVAMLAGLDTALGTDFGLSDIPGFSQAGTFRMYFTGPNGLTFNYADAGERAGDVPEMRWLAKRFRQPLYDWAAARSTGRFPQPLDLLWYEPVRADPKTTAAPRDSVFRAVDVALCRSAWDDPNALFVGFKGGSNAANHAHLDLGSFVFDALGERWVSNLGGDNYNLPAYFGKLRWTYYRLATAGQNTLLLNGINQDLKAKAPLVAFDSRNDYARAVVDLTAAYAPAGATSVRRGVALVDGRKALLVQDEFAAREPVEYRWQVHTRAQTVITADGQSALLTLNGKTMKVSLIGLAGAKLVAESATPPTINGGVGPQQNPNTGFTRLVAVLPEKTKAARVGVLFTPADRNVTVAMTPLDTWLVAAPPLPARGGAL